MYLKYQYKVKDGVDDDNNDYVNTAQRIHMVTTLQWTLIQIMKMLLLSKWTPVKFGTLIEIMKILVLLLSRIGKPEGDHFLNDRLKELLKRLQLGLS